MTTTLLHMRRSITLLYVVVPRPLFDLLISRRGARWTFSFSELNIPTFPGIMRTSSFTDCQRFNFLKFYLSDNAYTLLNQEAWERLHQHDKPSLIIWSLLNNSWVTGTRLWETKFLVNFHIVNQIVYLYSRSLVSVCWLREKGCHHWAIFEIFYISLRHNPHSKISCHAPRSCAAKAGWAEMCIVYTGLSTV